MLLEFQSWHFSKECLTPEASVFLPITRKLEINVVENEIVKIWREPINDCLAKKRCKKNRIVGGEVLHNVLEWNNYRK
jgi:hypothetical protein